MTGAPAPGFDHAVALIGGITGVLLCASAIGLGLKLASGARLRHAGIDNLNARVRSWWLIAGSLGMALLAGRAGATALFALVAFLALREFVRLPSDPPGRLPRMANMVAVVPLPFLALWNGWSLVWLAAMPVYALCIVPLFAAIEPDRTLSKALGNDLRNGTLLCVYTLSHLPALLWLEIPRHDGGAAFLLLYLVLVVQASDVLQYVWGKLLGRRRIAPKLSPSKTVEGTLGGILSATALGVALTPITPFTAPESASIALLLAVLGFGGGLLFSAIKRARGIKDWGTLLPGHGGMLDRVDSLCLTAPAFYWLVRLGWA